VHRRHADEVSLGDYRAVEPSLLQRARPRVLRRSLRGRESDRAADPRGDGPRSGRRPPPAPSPASTRAGRHGPSRPTARRARTCLSGRAGAYDFALPQSGTTSGGGRNLQN
jgi:hypothetical protein